MNSRAKLFACTGDTLHPIKPPESDADGRSSAPDDVAAFCTSPPPHAVGTVTRVGTGDLLHPCTILAGDGPPCPLCVLPNSPPPARAQGRSHSRGLAAPHNCPAFHPLGLFFSPERSLVNSLTAARPHGACLCYTEEYCSIGYIFHWNFHLPLYMSFNYRSNLGHKIQVFNISETPSLPLP